MADKKDIEALALSQDDMKTLQKAFVIFNSPRKTKLWRVFWSIGAAGIFIVAFVLVIYVSWLSFSPKNMSLIDIHATVAKFNLLEPSIEYKSLEHKFKDIILEYRAIETKLYGKPKRIALLTQDDIDKCISLIYLYHFVENIDYDLSFAVMAAESGFDKSVVSPAGACGLWQLMYDTFMDIRKNSLFRYREANIFDVYQNTESGLKYLTFCRNILAEKNNKQATIRELAWAYNGGHNNAMRAIKSKNMRYLDSETVEYGDKILFYYTNYKANRYDVYWRRVN